MISDEEFLLLKVEQKLQRSNSDIVKQESMNYNTIQYKIQYKCDTSICDQIEIE